MSHFLLKITCETFFIFALYHTIFFIFLRERIFNLNNFLVWDVTTKKWKFSTWMFTARFYEWMNVSFIYKKSFLHFLISTFHISQKHMFSCTIIPHTICIFFSNKTIYLLISGIFFTMKTYISLNIINSQAFWDKIYFLLVQISVNDKRWHYLKFSISSDLRVFPAICAISRIIVNPKKILARVPSSTLQIINLYNNFYNLIMQINLLQPYNQEKTKLSHEN